MPPRRPTTAAQDLAAARAVVPELADRAARLIAGMGDPKTVSQLPGWNVSDIAVHLGLACHAYADAVTGVFDVAYWDAFVPEHPDLQQRVAVLNALTVEKAGPDAYRAAPALIRDGAARLAAGLEGRDPDEPIYIPWFGSPDEPLTIASITGLFLNETSVHTLDIARVTGQPWRVQPSIARLIISLEYPDTMPRTLDPVRAAKLRAAVRLHVRGGVTLGIEVDGTSFETTRNPGPGRTDCHISVDPVAFVLTVAGRSSQLRQIAAGRMIAYGRKPWLGPIFGRLFIHP